jgi:hypothetical protein
MGIGHLLEDNPCQRSSSVYSPADHGWKNGKIILQKYLIILKVSLQKHNLVISVIFFFLQIHSVPFNTKFCQFESHLYQDMLDYCSLKTLCDL